MKMQDISAINNFSPKNNYLSVKKEADGEEHLELISANCWTGFCRRFSCSSASLDTVKRYMDAHLAGLQNTSSELDPNKLALLCSKIQSYQQNKSRSICSTLYATICWIFSCLFCCRNNPIPLPARIEEPKENEHTAPALKPAPDFPFPSDPALRHRIVANRRAFWKKFQKSAPYSDSFSKISQLHKRVAAYFHAECSRLQTFLKAPPSYLVEADMIYVCVGHGPVTEQVFPGCVLRALQEGLKVQALLFEHQNGRFGDFPPPMIPLDKECARNPKIDPQKVGLQLDGFSVDQFLCGFPNPDAQTWEDLSDKYIKFIEQGVLHDTYWETRAQKQEVIENFKISIDTLLRQGKKVIIGYHSGGISLTDPIVAIYNSLIENPITQLSFLWGWGGVNRSTNTKIEEEDTDPMKLTKIWKTYPPAEGGLAATWSLFDS